MWLGRGAWALLGCSGHMTMSKMITHAFVTFILAILYHLVKLVENVASSQVDRAPIDGDMCEVEKARVLELRHQSGDRKK